MSAMPDNPMLQPSALERHKERMETMRSRAIEAQEAAFFQALSSGHDVHLPTWWKQNGVEPLSSILNDSSDDNARQALLRACHLNHTGKYEAANLVLKEFVDLIALKYAEDMTESVEDEDDGPDPDEARDWWLEQRA